MDGVGPGAVTGAVLVVVLFAGIYFVPTILAFSRLHPRRWAILAINLLLGLTVIGWGVAFIWAIASPADDPRDG